MLHERCIKLPTKQMYNMTTKNGTNIFQGQAKILRFCDTVARESTSQWCPWQTLYPFALSWLIGVHSSDSLTTGTDSNGTHVRKNKKTALP